MTTDVHPAGLAALAIVLLAVIGTVAFLLTNGGLTRFQQTSLACSDPMLGTFELVLNGRSAGDEVRLIRPQGETRLPIRAIEGKELLLDLTQANLRVDPEAGTVSVLQGRRNSVTRCKITDFSM